MIIGVGDHQVRQLVSGKIANGNRGERAELLEVAKLDVLRLLRIAELQIPRVVVSAGVEPKIDEAQALSRNDVGLAVAVKVGDLGIEVLAAVAGDDLGRCFIAEKRRPVVPLVRDSVDAVGGIRAFAHHEIKLAVAGEIVEERRHEIAPEKASRIGVDHDVCEIVGHRKRRRSRRAGVMKIEKFPLVVTRDDALFFFAGIIDELDPRHRVVDCVVIRIYQGDIVGLEHRNTDPNGHDFAAGKLWFLRRSAVGEIPEITARIGNDEILQAVSIQIAHGATGAKDGRNDVAFFIDGILHAGIHRDHTVLHTAPRVINVGRCIHAIHVGRQVRTGGSLRADGQFETKKKDASKGHPSRPTRDLLVKHGR